RMMNTQAAAASPAQGPATPPAQAPASAFNQVAFNQTAAAQVGQPTATPPGTPQAAPAASAPAGPPPNDLLALLQSYGGVIISQLNSGGTGFDFADHLCALVGAGTHAMIANHGEDTLTQTLLSFPEIALYGEARIRRFVYEFINFEQL